MSSETNSNIEREKRILDAAAELFAHYGYAKTTVDEIAAQAGISKGAVYLHFRSKDALLERLIMRESEEMLDSIMERLENDPQGITLFNVYRYSLLVANENPLIRALYNRDRRVLGDYLRRIQKTPIFQQSMMFGADFISRFQSAGYIKPDVNPQTLSYLLISIRYGLMNIEEIAPNVASPPLDEMGELIGAMLQQAFGTEHGNSEEAKQALQALFEQGREMLRQVHASGNERSQE